MSVNRANQPSIHAKPAAAGCTLCHRARQTNHVRRMAFEKITDATRRGLVNRLAAPEWRAAAQELNGPVMDSPGAHILCAAAIWSAA